MLQNLRVVPEDFFHSFIQPESLRIFLLRDFLSIMNDQLILPVTCNFLTTYFQQSFFFSLLMKMIYNQHLCIHNVNVWSQTSLLQNCGKQNIVEHSSRRKNIITVKFDIII